MTRVSLAASTVLRAIVPCGGVRSVLPYVVVQPREAECQPPPVHVYPPVRSAHLRDDASAVHRNLRVGRSQEGAANH